MYQNVFFGEVNYKEGFSIESRNSHSNRSKESIEIMVITRRKS